MNNDFKVIKYPAFFKTEVFDELSKHGKHNVRRVMSELIREHNKANPNKQISLYGSSIPYVIYKKVVEYFNFD